MSVFPLLDNLESVTDIHCEVSLWPDWWSYLWLILCHQQGMTKQLWFPFHDAVAAYDTPDGAWRGSSSSSWTILAFIPSFRYLGIVIIWSQTSDPAVRSFKAWSLSLFALRKPTFCKSWLLISCNQLRCSCACKKLASCPCWAIGWDNSFPRFPFSKYQRNRKSEKFWIGKQTRVKSCL